jgi:hypothetical protein
MTGSNIVADARPVLNDANSVLSEEMAPPMRRSRSSVSSIKSSDMFQYHFHFCRFNLIQYSEILVFSSTSFIYSETVVYVPFPLSIPLKPPASSKEKTIIGKPLSRAKAIALASITANRFARTSL